MRYWRLAILGFLACATAAYAWPSDALYAFTIWPPFVWAGIGALLSLPGILKHRTLPQILLISAWLVFWLVFGEERIWMPSRLFSPPTGAARVVSMNCSGGSVDAAREALTGTPEIALLQESPSRSELESIVRNLYGPSGAVVSGPDASIVVKGKFVNLNLNFGNTNFLVALVETEKLGSLLVVSLRLTPPVFRLDYWNPECWRAYAENRRIRREELREVVEYVKDLSPDRLIIGGDFNTPPDRGTFAPLSQFADQASADSGYTAINEFPLARIDQVWSRGIPAARSRASRTVHSDHRKVEVWFRPSS